MLDPSPDPRLVEPPPPVEPERGPGLVGMLAGAVARSALQPVETLCSLGRTLGDLDTLPVLSTLPDARRIARAARALAGDTRAVPETPPLVHASDDLRRRRPGGARRADGMVVVIGGWRLDVEGWRLKAGGSKLSGWGSS